MLLTRRSALGLLAAPMLVRPAHAEAGPLVFAAASLRQGLEAALALWDGPGASISFAGTATLARQIEAGVPADLFLAANVDWMQRLADQGRLDGPARVILSNRLVLAGQAEEIRPARIEDALTALPEGARIATGFTEAVPVGIYARQMLEALGLYDAFAARLVQTENTRIAATLATRGEVARALIYASDVAADPDLAIEATAAADLHDPIAYPLARCAAGRHPDRAALFDHLAGPAALAAFQAHGFIGVAP